MILSACDNYSFLSSILLIKRIIEISCMIIPLILVLSAGISLAKIVFNSNIMATKKDIKKISNKFIAASLVFFVPLLVNLLMVLLDTTMVYDTECWTSANNETIAIYKKNKETEDKVQKELMDSEHNDAEKIRKEIEIAREKTRVENEKKSEEELKKYIVTGGSSSGDVVYYNQQDYKTEPYSTYGTIKSHGCGPTSAAIVASTLLKPSIHDPVESVAWACSHGACFSSGTSWSGVVGYLKSLGLQASTMYSWNDTGIIKLNEALLTGKSLAIILTHEPGNSCPFTNGGHYLVITGIKNGEYSIADPNSREKTKRTWPRSAFSGCGNATFYIFTKP